MPPLNALISQLNWFTNLCVGALDIIFRPTHYGLPWWFTWVVVPSCLYIFWDIYTVMRHYSNSRSCSTRRRSGQNRRRRLQASNRDNNKTIKCPALDPNNSADHVAKMEVSTQKMTTCSQRCTHSLNISTRFFVNSSMLIKAILSRIRKSKSSK